MKHQKCDRLFAQTGWRPDSSLCDCKDKEPTVHLQGGCHWSEKPGMKVTMFKLVVTCAICLKEPKVKK